MAMNAADAMPFAKSMGVIVEKFDKDEVIGHITVREDLCTMGGIMHGGAIMAFADALGAIGGFAVLPEGAKGTITVESKTNFLDSAPVGSKVIGVSKPMKVGALYLCGKRLCSLKMANRLPW